MWCRVIFDKAIFQVGPSSSPFSRQSDDYCVGFPLHLTASWACEGDGNLSVLLVKCATRREAADVSVGSTAGPSHPGERVPSRRIVSQMLDFERAEKRRLYPSKVSIRIRWVHETPLTLSLKPPLKSVDFRKSLSQPTNPSKDPPPQKNK